ncbi:MAG: NAD-dependent epimerase/dehydratase family protein [Candidatus Micropelagos sp.]
MRLEIDTSAPVLVTGATGFLAGWVVKQLVDAGATVHATVRSPEDNAKCGHLKTLSNTGKGKIILFKADLLEDGSYAEAMKGCRVVIHTASPFINNYNDARKDLIEPAVRGTKNVLNTVCSTPSVERVVLTSSCAAICGDTIDCQDAPDGILTEDVWNTTSSETHQPYSFSKVSAEKAAWDIADAQDKWRLVVINPGFIIGPSLSGQSTSATHDLVGGMGDGRMKSGVPAIQIGTVDVRDVADAHIRGAFLDDASGRHIVFKDVVSFLDLALMLSDKFDAGYSLPKKELPKWLVWLIGPLVDKTFSRKMISRNFGQPWRADNSKSVSALGLSYTSLKSSMEEMFQQMINQKRF